jgi:hypothetical protein
MKKHRRDIAGVIKLMSMERGTGTAWRWLWACISCRNHYCIYIALKITLFGLWKNWEKASLFYVINEQKQKTTSLYQICHLHLLSLFLPHHLSPPVL